MVCSLLCFQIHKSFMVGVLRQNATKCNRGRLGKLINNDIHESSNLNIHTSFSVNWGDDVAVKSI